MVKQLGEYGKLMRLDRPIGILLLLWPTLWALWIAGEGRPDESVFAVFVLGVIVMRSAGCVVNDLADRRFDPHVKRTRDRPLALGTVSVAEALCLFAGLMLIAFGLVLTQNRLTITLAFVGAFLAATYPFMKRFTSLPQLYLGVAFGWGVPMAFAAQTAALPQIAWLMFLIIVVWAIIYDTMYAMVDREDDLKLGLRSTAILFDEADRFIIGVLQLIFFAGLMLLAPMADLGKWYWLGLAGAAIAAIYQQLLIRDRDPASCFRAFLNNNALGASVFAGIALDYLFRSA
ncbi:MAG: 4-hydroxybenzoate octaprenyltransferase [Chromatiales bacterium]|nr:4-hydroxybenzoate octaprenyltransferase [Chromatiales bacterium]MDH3931801.1 4-hydroxybenzoate octaprenyltransferase [Chromatiales bacterium]MDH3945854.1 4-hydroxybenzoate octaprenyltransferase [Chromatiales bacterium]MDH4014398.1 4-hydroxybenzoate octaprenyltransferase [Chromatiales bacterium]